MLCAASMTASSVVTVGFEIYLCVKNTVPNILFALVRGFTEIGYVPKSREIYQKEPVMPLLFLHSFIIFYLRRFTFLNEVGSLTDGDTSKSHDSPTTFKMALYSWPKF